MAEVVRLGLADASRSCRPSASSAARGPCASCDDHVPGIDVPAPTIVRVDSAADQREAAYHRFVLAAHTPSRCPASRGIHITDFRHDESVGRLASASASRRTPRGGEPWTQSCGRRLRPSRSGTTSRSASSASGSTRRGARSSRSSCGPVTSRRSRTTSPRRSPAAPHVLDVNMGVPLTDEADLLRPGRQADPELTDLPLCIDSSVVEALEAGLAAYEGKALVNSVTARGRPARADPARWSRSTAPRSSRCPTTRRASRRPPRSASTSPARSCASAGEYGIPTEDIVIDPLAMTVGADTEAVAHHPRDDLADPRGVRREHDLRRLEHVASACPTGTR